MSTELNCLNYILLHWSLQRILLLLLLRIGLGLDSQYTLHEPIGDCLNCLIRKGSGEKLPFLAAQIEWFIFIFLSHLRDVDSTERGRARGNTFWRVISSLVQSVFYVIYDE